MAAGVAEEALAAGCTAAEVPEVVGQAGEGLGAAVSVVAGLEEAGWVAEETAVAGMEVEE